MPRLPSDSPALCALAKFASVHSLVFGRALSCLGGALLLASGTSYKIRVPKAPPRLLVKGTKVPQETGYICCGAAGSSISNKQPLVKVSWPQGIWAQFSSRLWITLKSSKLKLLDISRAMEQSMLNPGHDQVERVFTSSVYLFRTFLLWVL